MIDVLLLWSASDDRTAQDEAIAKLLPILKGRPGLRHLRVSEGDLMARGGPPPYSRVVEASFDSLANYMATVDVLNSRRDVVGQPVIPQVIFFEVREV